MRRLMITLFAVLLLAACEGNGSVGDECQGGAAENDCVEGAICTVARSASVEPPAEPNAGERFYCRTICDLDVDCEAGFECRQAAGTMYRSCQPSDAPGDAGM